MNPIPLLAVALTAEETADFFPGTIPDLRGLASDVRFVDTAGITREAYAARLAAINPDVLVACWSTPPLPAILPPRLRYACYVAGGVRNFVSRAHLERGLLLTNWGSSISRIVAECALLLTLAALRRVGKWVPSLQRDGGWRGDRPESDSLFCRRVGIHGFGNSAREFIKLLKPFGVEVGVCAPEDNPADYAAHGVRRIPDLDALFSGSDVVVELAPLNAATRGIVTERLLRLIPEGGVFVNVARGAIVDEEALVRVAREGRINLGLDVFAVEPLPADSGLRGLPNVVLLPHTAGPTMERRRDAGAFALRNLQAYVEGRPLEAVITPEIFDQLT